MSAINDLILQIQDPALRERIQKEVNKLAKQKKFGLVFEEHIPESTPLYNVPIKQGCNVVLRNSKEDKLTYVVLKVEGERVTCVNKDHPEINIVFDKTELVRIAEFGESIYPNVVPVDYICNDIDSDLWHALIEADNFHALQLLESLCGKGRLHLH